EEWWEPGEAEKRRGVKRAEALPLGAGVAPRGRSPGARGPAAGARRGGRTRRRAPERRGRGVGGTTPPPAAPLARCLGPFRPRFGAARLPAPLPPSLLSSLSRAESRELHAANLPRPSRAAAPAHLGATASPAPRSPAPPGPAGGLRPRPPSVRGSRPRILRAARGGGGGRSRAVCLR
ncbi:hypothetical protein MC885_009452, partial [Smutsia gigantea]